jgi:hypothetical protein
MTWGTLLFEFAFPTLVWFRRTRWVLLASGVVFHIMIDVLMIIPMFSWIMIVSYASFIEDRDVHRVLRWFGWKGAAEVAPQAEEDVAPQAEEDVAAGGASDATHTSRVSSSSG